MEISACTLKNPYLPFAQTYVFFDHRTRAVTMMIWHQLRRDVLERYKAFLS